jgi:hypothetical protein
MASSSIEVYWSWYHTNVAISSINVPKPIPSISDAWPVLARDRLISVTYQYNIILMRGRTAIFVTHQYNIILDAWPYSHWLATA